MRIAASGAACAKLSVPKRWLVLELNAPPDAQRDALVEGLLALGGGAVHESDDALITYIAPPDDLQAWLAQARETLQTEFEWRWQADEDWTQKWKRGLRARRVGAHFIVTPTW